MELEHFDGEIADSAGVQPFFVAIDAGLFDDSRPPGGEHDLNRPANPLAGLQPLWQGQFGVRGNFEVFPHTQLLEVLREASFGEPEDVGWNTEWLLVFQLGRRACEERLGQSGEHFVRSLQMLV